MTDTTKDNEAPKGPSDSKAMLAKCSWCGHVILPEHPTATSDGDRMHISCAAESEDDVVFDRDFCG